MWTYFNQISFLDVSSCSVLCMGIHFLASCQVYALLVHKSLYRMGRNLPLNLLFLRLVYEVFMKTYDTSLSFALFAVLGPLRFKTLNVILADTQR